MDKRDLAKPMTEFDWMIIGGHTYRKNGKPTLPRRRLDIPIPSRVEECHTIAHRLSGLSQAIGQAARLAPTTRSGLYEVSGLIEQARLSFAALGKEWEMELREADAESKLPAETGEQLRVIK
jgi:hypothetical protein